MIDVRSVTFNVPYYSDYVHPLGRLTTDAACQALWHYYITAISNYKGEIEDMIYEGDLDPTYNYKQLMSSIALMYNTTPEEMVRFWFNIDTQAKILQLTPLPDKEHYRMNHPLIIVRH